MGLLKDRWAVWGYLKTGGLQMDHNYTRIFPFYEEHFRTIFSREAAFSVANRELDGRQD